MLQINGTIDQGCHDAPGKLDPSGKQWQPRRAVRGNNRGQCWVTLTTLILCPPLTFSLPLWPQSSLTIFQD